MAAQKFTDNATSTLTGDLAIDGTSISVQSGDAGKFASLSEGDYQMLRIVDGAGNMEIVKATARSGATITIERAQEGTSAKAFSAGANVSATLTAASLERLQKMQDIPSASTVRSNLGLGNVDNTSDEDKPISAAVQAAFTVVGNELDEHEGRIEELEETVGTLSDHKIPEGTKALFFNSTAPTGWTKDTDQNDKAIRLVSGSGGSTGGSSPFSTVFAKTATDGTTLSTLSIPAINHRLRVANSANAGLGLAQSMANVIDFQNPGNTGTGDTHSGTITDTVGSGSAHAHGMDIRVQYVDAIKCTKGAYA